MLTPKERQLVNIAGLAVVVTTGVILTVLGNWWATFAMAAILVGQLLRWRARRHWGR
jgi:hypothetical protein